MGPANRHQHLTAGKRPNPFLSRRQPHLPVHVQRHQKKGLSSLPRAASWLIVILIFISLLSVIEPESLLVPKILSMERLSSAVSTTTTGIHWPWDPKRSEECRPPSANLFSRSPPRPTHTEVVKSMAAIDKYLSDRASKADIDSISVALVTPAGTLWQGGYGVLRANETGDAEKGTVDGDSIYRIASISKAFTVLETLILRERGALSWDDPIERYIPQLTIPPESYGWANHLDGLESDNHKTRVTLKDLASHLGGIGRDYPPVDIGEWPFPEEQAPRSAAPSVLPSARRFNPLTGEYEPHELPDILRAVSEYPLVNHPQTYPIYSNTGIDLLGLANIRANALHSSSSSSDDPAEQPTTHRDLLRRDIFAPLQMNSTFFRLPTSNHLRQHIAVPSSTETSVWADISLGDADDPAGGQYSSLSDLARFMKTLLDPLGRGGIVPARVVREWLRPVYVWGETSKQVGLPWEIMELSGVTAYTKGGNLPGYHSEFAVFPEYSLGIILLVTGDYDDTTTILGEVSKRALPTFSNLHNAELKRRYVGAWTNGEDVAEIALDEGKGAIHLSKLVVRGIDVVQRAYDLWNRGASKGKPKNRIFLWPTGRLGEFRLAFGRPQLNDVKDVGCTPYWLSLDPGFNSRGAPLDLVYWKAGMLYYPSAGVRFGRQK